jgi:hypothetical protein
MARCSYRVRSARTSPLVGPARHADVAAAGTVNVNVVPAPGELSTAIAPPCASTIPFAMSQKSVPAAASARWVVRQQRPALEKSI